MPCVQLGMHPLNEWRAEIGDMEYYLPDPTELLQDSHPGSEKE